MADDPNKKVETLPADKVTPPAAPKAELSATERAQALLDKLWADSKLGPQVRSKAKELYPDIVLPEDVAAPLVEPLKAQITDLETKLTGALDRLTKREKADEDAAAEVEMSKKIRAAQAAYGLTDDGLQKMVDRMKETKNFTDADAAAAWVVQHSPKPQVANTPSWLPQSANLFGSQEKVADEKFELLHTNPQKYADNELREFVADPDKYVAETFGRA